MTKGYSATFNFYGWSFYEKTLPYLHGSLLFTLAADVFFFILNVVDGDQWSALLFYVLSAWLICLWSVYAESLHVIRTFNMIDTIRRRRLSL